MFFAVEIQIIGDVEIQVAVQITIGQRRARAPVGYGYTSLGGDIEEARIRASIVAIEYVFLQAGYVEVRVAVVVVVGADSSHAPTPPLGAGGSGDIGEAGSVVAVEGVAAALARRVEGGAIDPVDIKVAVAVEVQHGRPAALGLDDILFLRVAAGVGFAQTEIGGDIDEAGRERIRMCQRREQQQRYPL